MSRNDGVLGQRTQLLDPVKHEKSDPWALEGIDTGGRFDRGIAPRIDGQSIKQIKAVPEDPVNKIFDRSCIIRPTNV